MKILKKKKKPKQFILLFFQKNSPNLLKKPSYKRVTLIWRFLTITSVYEKKRRIETSGDETTKSKKKTY